MTSPQSDRLSAAELAKILELVEKSDFDSIELSIGDFHFTASRHGAPQRTTTMADAAPASVQPSSPRPKSAPPAAPAVAATVPASAPADDPGLIAIKAPIVGIFYVSPEPGAAPFVREGDRIEPGATVGLIEVMKVFNAVPAGLAGTVVRCLVADSELVEHGQPLFLIRPEGV